MSFRNTRGNNAANSPNISSNGKWRYGTRSSGTGGDYATPAYSTQSGYQQAASAPVVPPVPQQYSQPAPKQQQQGASAVKQEYESPAKREELANPTPATPPQATMDTENQEGEDKFDRPWKRRGFQKLPKKVRKKRLNAKLRNLLAPKNAMMVLHELHPGLTCSTTEETSNAGQPSYSVTIEIDGKVYRGQGLSKAQAKQTACESALKAALLEKMSQSVLNKPPANDVANAEAMDTTETEAANGGEGGEAVKPRRPVEEDDVPWGSLASYALFKLFSEWQSQGYTLPTSPGRPQGTVASTFPQQSGGGGAANAPNTMMPMKKIPEDAAQRHPVQLLNQLKPNSQYVESREGNPPNMVFTFTVTFDDQTFTGDGPNKKDAKKACAKNALISMGIQYPD